MTGGLLSGSMLLMSITQLFDHLCAGSKFRFGHWCHLMFYFWPLCQISWWQGCVIIIPLFFCNSVLLGKSLNILLYNSFLAFVRKDAYDFFVRDPISALE